MSSYVNLSARWVSSGGVDIVALYKAQKKKKKKASLLQKPSLKTLLIMTSVASLVVWKHTINPLSEVNLPEGRGIVAASSKKSLSSKKEDALLSSDIASRPKGDRGSTFPHTACHCGRWLELINTLMGRELPRFCQQRVRVGLCLSHQTGRAAFVMRWPCVTCWVSRADVRAGRVHNGPRTRQEIAKVRKSLTVPKFSF